MFNLGDIVRYTDAYIREYFDPGTDQQNATSWRGEITYVGFYYYTVQTIGSPNEILNRTDGDLTYA
jgi:hypothetical protein